MRKSILIMESLLLAALLWHGGSSITAGAGATGPATSKDGQPRAISILWSSVSMVLEESKAKALRFSAPEGKRSGFRSMFPAHPSRPGETLRDWQNIMTEDFEGLFPQATGWSTFNSFGYAPYYWGKDDYKPHQGTYSGWCAGDHKVGNPELDPATDPYPHNMKAWMIWGPFSLRDATDAELLFYYWLDSEEGYDFFSSMASIDGTTFYGTGTSGNSGGWVGEEFDLTDVYTLGDLTGQAEVWIAFLFQSDAITNATGAFVDDIVLRKLISEDLPPTITHTPLDIAQAGQDVTIPATITDDVGVTSADVHYRRVGETSFTTVAMTSVGDQYSGVIPGSVVTHLGVEYYISASDGTNMSYHPPENWETSPHVIQVMDQAPTIVHTPVGIASEWIDMTITAIITDDVGVTGANLSYRRGGESSFTTVSMTATRAEYSGTIPGGDITSRGLEYYISASDGVNTSYEPPENYLTSPHVTRVQVENLAKAEPQPGGSDQTAYRMISVPLELDDPGVDAVLEDDLGAYDDTRWRLLRYHEGGYLEYSLAGDFTPGKAFWLIVRESGKTIDAGSGTTVTTADTFAITLKPGWNDIALPFDFPVSWSQISVDTSQINGPYAYADEWMLPSSVTYLSPWKGYAVKNLSESDIVMKIPPIFGMDASWAGVSPFHLAKPSSVKWFVRLSAQCEQARDGINYLGCSEVALEQRDALDLSEPPPVGSYVSLYFPHLDWIRHPDRLTTDFRPPIEEGENWKFVVETNIPNSTVWLSWDHVEFLPISLEAFLFDAAEKVSLNLRTQKNYSFASGGKREFLLVVGTEEYQSRQTQTRLPKGYMLYQNFPNPFNPLTQIFFDLPTKSEFKLTLFNVLGEEVKIIAWGEYPAGHHQVSLGVENLAAGVYFYKMEAGGFVDVKKMVVLK